ncbi:MAG: hypothetical protein OEZ06_16785 [Myxococcales bacterium]|nr:hypothetical protein [Myxococcales bacterium]
MTEWRFEWREASPLDAFVRLAGNLRTAGATKPEPGCKLGDKSPKSKKRNQKQKEAAKQREAAVAKSKAAEQGPQLPTAAKRGG